MTSTYPSHATVSPTPIFNRQWWSRKKIVVASVAAVTVLGGGTAWAAIALFGFGSINSAAATTTNLTVDNSTVKLTSKLLPGKTVGSQGDVTNPNDFDIVVTRVLVKDASVDTVPASDECRASVHLVSNGSEPWPGNGGGTATAQNLASPVTIPAGQTRTVTVPQAVRQDASATTLCGVKADFAVKAQNAS